MIVTDERVAQFMSRRLGKEFSPPYSLMGIEKSGEIIAGVLFNVYEKPDIHFSAAGKGWTRKFIQSVGEYVFGQLECKRATCVTENIVVVHLATRLGGKIEGVLRDHFGCGRDGIIVGILKKDFKYGFDALPA